MTKPILAELQEKLAAAEQQLTATQHKLEQTQNKYTKLRKQNELLNAKNKVLQSYNDELDRVLRHITSDITLMRGGLFSRGVTATKNNATFFVESLSSVYNREK